MFEVNNKNTRVTRIRQITYHVDTSQEIWKENQLTGFYMIELFVINRLVCWMSSKLKKAPARP